LEGRKARRGFREMRRWMHLKSAASVGEERQSGKGVKLGALPTEVSRATSVEAVAVKAAAVWQM
jgi:hypothetical protein